MCYSFTLKNVQFSLKTKKAKLSQKRINYEKVLFKNAGTNIFHVFFLQSNKKMLKNKIIKLKVFVGLNCCVSGKCEKIY
jgi:hypothetical protein